MSHNPSSSHSTSRLYPPGLFSVRTQHVEQRRNNETEDLRQLSRDSPNDLQLSMVPDDAFDNASNGTTCLLNVLFLLGSLAAASFR
jgi:hypothetical protein